jgi:hypothetical protein
METFNFYLDTKVTTWYRTNFEIDADNLEDARKKAIEMYNKGTLSELGWEQIYDTIENMSIIDNGGYSTEELYLEDELIFDNANSIEPQRIDVKL